MVGIDHQKQKVIKMANTRKAFLRAGSVEKALRAAKLITKSEHIKDITFDRGMIVVSTETKEKK